MASLYIKKFDIDTSGLAASEKKVLGKLVAAAELIAPLYEKQKNSKYPGANFYPSDASREEIEQAAKKNQEILSPYTFVERKGKQLVAVPYSKKFKKELTQIATLLKEAAALSEGKALKAYLVARADDLLRDNFDKSNTLWLKTADSKIGFVLGPFDRFHDKLFFAKRAYKAYLGVLDVRATKDMEGFRAALLAAQRKHLPGAKHAKVSNMKLRVSDTAAFAGIEADFFFAADNLPASADLYLIKKYGTISTIFKPVLQWRFDNWILPAFQGVFTKDVQNNYPKEELWNSFLRITAFCEVCHSLMRYDDAAARLEEFFPYFDNIYADTLTVKSASTLFLKGALSEREFEAIILGEICQGLYYIGFSKERPHLESFARGYAVFFTFLLEAGALMETKQGFQIDFKRSFMAIDELANVFDYYLSLGSRNDAKDFMQRYSVEKVLNEFAPYLKNL